MPGLEPPFVVPPREREIEFFARVVRAFLWLARGVFVVTGVAAVAGSTYVMYDPTTVYSEADPVPPLSTRVAHQIVWWCLAIPLVLPVGFTFGRGRWPLLALGALLWFGPMALEGDHDWGWLIRVFATFVAGSVLLVWKTLYGLTQRAA